MRKRLFIGICALLGAMTAAAQEPLLRFGVFADAQYDPDATENTLHRYYARSRERLADAIEAFNGEGVDFTVSLGDLIDRSADALADILPVLGAAQKPVYYVYGNHDYPQPYDKNVQKQIFKTLGQDDRYRSIDCGKVRIILLNTNEIALYSSKKGSKGYVRAEAICQTAKDAGLPYAKKYNGAVSAKQLSWLKKELKKARKKGQKVLVMGHSPIAPETGKCLSLNAAAIRDILSANADIVLGYLAGHEHKGGLEMLGAIPCLTFKGMCEGTANRYAIVSVYDTGLIVRGLGDQESFHFERAMKR